MENNRVKQIGNLTRNASRDNPQHNRVYDGSGLSPTIDTMAGRNKQPMIVQKLGYMESGYRIRKLTPRECYRLMGFDDEAFDRAAEVNSNTQLYKQAGNSIVVDVLMAIFENLLVKGRSVRLDELLSDE